MLTLKDLKSLSDKDTLWDLLKSDTLRSKFADLIMDVALNSKPAEVDMLTNDALRAWSARVEFAKTFNDSIPKSPEAAKKAFTQVAPTPVE